MLRRVILLSLAIVALLAISASSAQAKSCSLTPAEQGGQKPSTLGGTYILSLSAKRTSCGKAKGVVRGFHDCRGSGKTCGRKVNGYKCGQKVVAESPVQYDATVTCRNGSKKVKFTYTQFT